MKIILKTFLPLTPILYFLWGICPSNTEFINENYNIYIFSNLVLLYLAFHIFMYQKLVQEVKSIKDLRQKHNNTVEIDANRIKQQNIELNAKKSELEKFNQFLESLESERKIGLPYAANIIADYKCELDRHIENSLKYKTRPSLKGADAVKILSREKRELIIENVSLKTKILEYEWLYPEFSDLVDLNYGIHESKLENECFDDESERWLSDENYAGLSIEEKCQRALDKYSNRKMKNWEIGREYERYIGYLYEIDGWEVSYFGIVKGFEDLGRDIIAQKNGVINIIQCKYWSEIKIIHEKHVLQTFATALEYYLSEVGGSINDYQSSLKNKKVNSLLYTSTKLSDQAKKMATALNVKCQEFHKIDWKRPLIKCNISKKGDKIFHLPFDQQYDRIKINIRDGEMFTHSIEDAVSKGFRRAKKWVG